MGGVQRLILRVIFGAVVGGILGFVADLVVRTQGYWVVGLMAGLIGGALTVYVGYGNVPEEMPAPGEDK